MPSSRATIAAGTRPPRVTQTIAWNGPAPSSRHASARASRWNWSHETGKAFCGCGCGCSSGCAIVFPDRKGWDVLAHVEHKIEPRDEPVTSLGHSHHQLAAEQSVAAVHRLIRKIELGGEHALLRRLHLDVVVAGAAGIERRQDGAQAVATLAIGEQMPAIAKAGAVVLAALVGMPEVEERLRDGPAGTRQDLPAELDRPRRAVRLDEIGAQRRTGLEIRPLGLPHGRLIAVVALRRWCKRLRERVIERKAGRGERAQHSAACGMKRHDGLLACEPTPLLQSYPRSHAAGHHERVSAAASSPGGGFLQVAPGNDDHPPLDCAPLTRCSMSSTARMASASFCASRARRTTLVLGPCCGSKNG